MADLRVPPPVRTPATAPRPPPERQGGPAGSRGAAPCAPAAPAPLVSWQICGSPRRSVAQQLLHGLLGRDRVDRQTRPQFQAGNLAKPRVDLPMPMVRRVDTFAERSRVKNEVVGRTVQTGQASEDLAQRLSGGCDVGVAGAGEVRGMTARHDPDLEGRTRGVRGEGDAGLVLPDHPRPVARLLADEAAVRALALADHEARGPTYLLRNPMRDLRQVV